MRAEVDLRLRVRLFGAARPAPVRRAVAIAAARRTIAHPKVALARLVLELFALSPVFALAAGTLICLAYEPTDPALYVSLAIVVLALGVMVWKVRSMSPRVNS